jgi:methionine-rich copper-binding protein CopC
MDSSSKPFQMVECLWVDYNGVMKTLGYLMLLMAGLGLVTTALAHGSIARTSPADGDQLESAPQQIQVWFSEAITPGSGSMTMINGQGQAIDLGQSLQSLDDPSLLVAPVPTQLPNAAYIVTASGQVVSDGHIAEGSFVFWVGEQRLLAQASDSPAPAYWLLGLFGGVGIGSAMLAWLWSRREYPLMIMMETPSSAQASRFPLGSLDS